jgi:hypothetical protein
MVDTSPIDYKKRFNKIMARLRAGGGLGMLRLEDKEIAEITIIGDVEEWIEVPTHRLKAERRNVVCGEFVGDDQCPYCAQGVRQTRKIAIPIYNETLGQVQIVLWAHYADSPLNELEEVYNTNGVPFRGMQFSIKRRGTGIETRYPMEYRGHKDGDLSSLAASEDAAEVKVPARQAIAGLVVDVLSASDE